LLLGLVGISGGPPGWKKLKIQKISSKDEQTLDFTEQEKDKTKIEPAKDEAVSGRGMR